MSKTANICVGFSIFYISNPNEKFWMLKLYFSQARFLSVLSRFNYTPFQPSPLFAKLEADKVAEWKRRFGASTADQGTQKPEKPKSAGGKKGEQKKNMAGGNKSEFCHIYTTVNMWILPENAQESALPPEVAELQKRLETVFQKYETLNANNTSEANKVLDELEKNYNDLKKLLEICAVSWEKQKVEQLSKENTTLSREVESLVKKLTELEVAAGIKQVAVPDRGSDKTPQESAQKAEPPATKASNETKPAKEKQPKGGNKPANPPVDESIDVGRLDLRVGRIVEAKKHPDADALYVETIDFGEEKPRTVVSGLVKHVPLEQV